MRKNLKKVAAITGTSILLAVQGCSSNVNAHIDGEKVKLEQEKESLFALNESLSLELENEQDYKEELEQELQDIKQKYGIPSENEYLKNDLTLFSIQSNGQVFYRFVEFDRYDFYSFEEYESSCRVYRSITHVGEEYNLESYTYDNHQMVDFYEMNIGRQYFLPSEVNKITLTLSNNIPFPHGYENKEIYSYDDLVEIESILNSKDYEIQSSPVNNQFNIYELSLVNLNGYFMFVDEFFTKEFSYNEKSFHDFLYLVSITNPSISLKCELKEDTGYQFSEFSCLDSLDDILCYNMIEWNTINMTLENDVTQYFDIMPFEKISYDDIKKVEAQLNKDYKLVLKQK